MNLNELQPADGSRKKSRRVGRGIGSGFGKTCGRGHKGLKSRSGGSVKPGFEGGQMPLRKRVPKFGFSSRVSRVSAEVRLSELEKIAATESEITLDILKKHGVVHHGIKRAKVFLSGTITKAVTLTGIGATKGAREAIEAAGGSVAVPVEQPAEAS